MQIESELLERVTKMVSEGMSVAELSEKLRQSSPDFVKQVAGVPRKNITSFIVECAQEYPLGTTIIDLGCGRRSHFFEVNAMQKPGLLYLAIDHTVEYKELFDRTTGPNVVADAACLPFPDNQAGSVICTDLLEHVPNDSFVLREIFRVLKPDGLLFLTVPGKDIPKHDKFPYQIDYRRYTSQDLSSLLINSDFTIVQESEKKFLGFQTNIFFVCKK